jgi:hypothetical protein
MPANRYKVDADAKNRTAAAIPLAVTIVDAGSTRVFLQIGAKAAQLRDLGMSDRAIARALGVSDKTVAKSIVAGQSAAESADEPLANR